MKIDRYTLFGIFFIFIAVSIFFTDVFNPFIRPITHLFLMGSSKGKDILFFLILGIFLIFSQLFEYNGNFRENKYIKKISSNKILSIFKLENNTYIKFSIFLILVTAILGLIMELIIRSQMGISPFTIFVAMDPTPTTTSILHSHIYKSVIGGVIGFILSNLSLGVPIGVNTGDSLYQYVPKLANIIIIVLPILFLSQLGSMKDRLAPSRLILIFASTIGLIGIFDGGLFSVPCAGAVYGMLLIYFDGNAFDYYTIRLFNKLHITNKDEEYIEKIRNKVNFSYKSFKRYIPHIFLALIILTAISISIIGTNTENYEINIINQTSSLAELNNTLSDYSVISIENNNDNNINVENNNINIDNNNSNNSNNIDNNNDKKTLILISPKYNEMELLNSLIKSLKNQGDAFSMSWNFYSYINSNNTNLTNNK